MKHYLDRAHEQTERTVKELSGPMGRDIPNTTTRFPPTTTCEHGVPINRDCGPCLTQIAEGCPTLDAKAAAADRALDGRRDLGLETAAELKAAKPQGRLPSDANRRKAIPVATGCLDYFPDALAEIATLSRIGNDKHNPGQPLHWSRGKSNDHPDCLIRHFLERGTVDYSGAEPVLHSTQMAWRALAILQLELEALERRSA